MCMYDWNASVFAQCILCDVTDISPPQELYKVCLQFEIVTIIFISLEEMVLGKFVP